MKKIAYDTVRLDSVKIVQDTKRHLKVNAAITAVGVYQYPDGLALKCAPELLKATRTARYAKLMIAKEHPETLVIMTQQEIGGGVEKPFYDSGTGRIWATLDFDKEYCPPDVITDLQHGNGQDVSIGFYYQPDFTPGTWRGKSYDYVSRDMVIDHVLVCRDGTKGRCSYPTCGIGVDTMMRRIAVDPFGGYTGMSDCIAQNQDKTNPAGFCAWLEHELTGKWPAEDNHKFKGGKKTLSKKTMSERKTHEELEAEFNECVRKKMEEGAVYDPPMTRGQAEALCAPATVPEDEPKPVPEHLDAKELSPWQTAVKTYMDKGDCAKDAEAKAKADGIVKSDEDAAFENCVNRKMEEGKSREEAEKECRAEHPVEEGDDEPEPTELERCIANRMEVEGETEEQAREWCVAELAGEHKTVDTLIDRSKNLINLRSQRDIERHRQARQHPV